MLYTSNYIGYLNAFQSMYVLLVQASKVYT